MKIQVLIVEDEPPIARSLRRMIEGESDRFTVVAALMNGREAVEFLERESVDVIFTDIRMPIMDGIELLSCLNTAYPDILKVVISGYQEFEYARKAVQFRAFDYLLKPVVKSDLSALLTKIAGSMTAKKAETKRQQLISILNQTGIVEQPSSSMWNHCYYAAGIVCAGSYPVTPYNSMIPARAFWEERGILEDEICSLLAEREECWVIDGKSSAEKVIVLGFDDRARMDVLGQLYTHLRVDDELFITMIISPMLNHVSELGRFYPVLCSFLYQKTVFGFSQFLVCDETDSGLRKQGQAVLQDNVEIETLVLEISRRNWRQADFRLQDLFAHFAERRLPQIRLVHVLSRIAHQLHSQMNDRFSITDLDTDIREAITNARSYNDLREILLSIFENLSEGSRAEEIPSVVRDVELFIFTHFKETITNETLSRRFGYVPTYISRLFRMHKGMSPSQYLTSVRIARAKAIMCKQPDLMMKEVSEMVGFNDPLYFSRVFQKETGTRPTDYKSK